MDKLWIVGQVIKRHWNFRNDCWEDEAVWEFTGVFESEQLAVFACKDASYFVMPMTLNEASPHEKQQIPGSYYPLEKKDSGDKYKEALEKIANSNLEDFQYKTIAKVALDGE